MKDFPEFMKNKKNALDEGSQSSGVEGYVYDGADGSQMIHWTCKESGISSEHVHVFDEYMLVVQGRYDMIINGKKTPLSAGMEYHISKGVPHAGEFIAGTRTIHCFGGPRARRR